jgi:hypothetical protein
MMHTVKYRIGPRTQVGRALSDISKCEEKLLPELIHHEHAMGGIAVKKECLREQRKVPMKYEEEQDDGHGVLICVRVKPIEIGPKNETASLLFLKSFEEKPTQSGIIIKRMSEDFVEK